jgi:hypothetical protein
MNRSDMNTITNKNDILETDNKDIDIDSNLNSYNNRTSPNTDFNIVPEILNSTLDWTE